MIPDSFMILILLGFYGLLFGFLFSWQEEFFYKSKLALFVLMGLLSLLFLTSFHTTNCQKDYRKECGLYKVDELTYNFCLNKTYINDAETTWCEITPSMKCKKIKSPCINQEEVHIDGYCLSILPLCFLFNT